VKHGEIKREGFPRERLRLELEFGKFKEKVLKLQTCRNLEMDSGNGARK
ncbi:uncharacterized, partial [Tachysurus ichikawai]